MSEQMYVTCKLCGEEFYSGFSATREVSATLSDWNVRCTACGAWGSFDTPDFHSAEDA